MKWIVLVFLLIVVIGVIVTVRRGADPSSPDSSPGFSPGSSPGRDGGRSKDGGGWDSGPGTARRRRCLHCRGTGWVGGEPERTMNFTGEGFENRHTPATPCPDCNGTGFADL